jgi:hypothetical protein
MMFNSRNLGALIVDEDPHVKSWEDGQYNIMNMSIEETYGFGRMSRRDGPSLWQRPGRPSKRVREPARTVLDQGSLFPRSACRLYNPLPGGGGKLQL